jgi:uncharacterized phage protein gp47/JayE
VAFQIKSFLTIVASMINRMRATTTVITDYTVGSVARTMIEAPAQEIDALYLAMVQALQDAIPIATFLSFNFSLLPATYASGFIQISITVQSTAVTIAVGATFTAPIGGLQYVSTALVTIPAGSTTASVPVICTVVGSTGNQPAGTAFTMAPLPLGYVSAVTAAGIASGTNAETEAQRLSRFQSFISTLARSPLAGIAYGASTATVLDANGNVIESVALDQNNVPLVAVYEPYYNDHSQPVGIIQIYIYNGTSGASSQLIANCQQIINGYYDTDGTPVYGYKAAGTAATVYAVTLQAVNVTMVLTLDPSFDAGQIALAEAQVQALLTSYITDSAIGGAQQGSPGYVVAEAIALAMSVPGVIDVPIGSLVPSSNVVPATGVKLTPGTFAIT